MKLTGTPKYIIELIQPAFGAFEFIKTSCVVYSTFSPLF